MQRTIPERTCALYGPRRPRQRHFGCSCSSDFSLGRSSRRLISLDACAYVACRPSDTDPGARRSFSVPTVAATAVGEVVLDGGDERTTEQPVVPGDRDRGASTGRWAPVSSAQMWTAATIRRE